MNKVKNALELALGVFREPYCDAPLDDVIKACEEALSNHIEDNLNIVNHEPAPVQEFVAWHVNFGNEDEPNYVALGEKPNEPTANVRPLVFGDTTPQQRKPLTYEQRKAIIKQECRYTSEAAQKDHQCLIDAVEAAHDIKENT